MYVISRTTDSLRAVLKEIRTLIVTFFLVQHYMCLKILVHVSKNVYTVLKTHISIRIVLKRTVRDVQANIASNIRHIFS